MCVLSTLSKNCHLARCEGPRRAALRLRARHAAGQPPEPAAGRPSGVGGRARRGSRRAGPRPEGRPPGPLRGRRPRPAGPGCRSDPLGTAPRPAGPRGRGRAHRGGPVVTCWATRPPARDQPRCSRPRACGRPPRRAPGTEGSGLPCSGRHLSAPQGSLSVRRLSPPSLHGSQAADAPPARPSRPCVGARWRHRASGPYDNSARRRTARAVAAFGVLRLRRVGARWRHARERRQCGWRPRPGPGRDTPAHAPAPHAESRWLIPSSPVLATQRNMAAWARSAWRPLPLIAAPPESALPVFCRAAEAGRVLSPGRGCRPPGVPAARVRHPVRRPRVPLLSSLRCVRVLVTLTPCSFAEPPR